MRYQIPLVIVTCTIIGLALDACTVLYPYRTLTGFDHRLWDGQPEDLEVAWL